MKKLLLITLLVFSNYSLAAASLVYVPRQFDAATARMVVTIHGCLQSSEAMALGTGWNILAEEHNLAILYPQVESGTHKQDCWRYWLPENQRPGSGDLGKLHDEIGEWKSALGMPADAVVYLNGISSGAAMVASLLACYPNDFAAGVLHSGVSYGLATTEKDALKVQSKGPKASTVSDRPCDPRNFRGAIMVVHGERDRTINPGHVERVMDDFIGPAERVISTGKENGGAYTVTDFRVQGVLRGRTVLMKRLAHAWSGFNLTLRKPEVQPWSLAAIPIRVMNFGEYATTKIPFFSNKGPSSTRLAYDFFESVAPAKCDVHLN